MSPLYSPFVAKVSQVGPKVEGLGPDARPYAIPMASGLMMDEINPRPWVLPPPVTVYIRGLIKGYI